MADLYKSSFIMDPWLLRIKLIHILSGSLLNGRRVIDSNTSTIYVKYLFTLIFFFNFSLLCSLFRIDFSYKVLGMEILRGVKLTEKHYDFLRDLPCAPVTLTIVYKSSKFPSYVGADNHTFFFFKLILQLILT